MPDGLAHSRSAIEALRAGVPNRAAIRLLGISEPELRERFLNGLRQCAVSGAPARREGLIIAGGFGAGKSHLLGYLRELALQEEFVVSLVPISKETPLFDPGKLYAAAIRNAVVPDRNDDVMTTVVDRLVSRRDAFEQLEHWTSDSASGMAPLFAALLHLLPRQTVAPENVATVARFLGGGKLGIAQVRQWLREAGSAKLFDVRPVKEAELVQQRLRFAPRLFRAAGYRGWCLLLDEAELVARYGPVQRGRSYAELARWMGLDDEDCVSGILTVCAITDDFTGEVFNSRRDDELIPPRLETKGLDRAAELARRGMKALERNHIPLPKPDRAALRSSLERVGQLYRDAYDWAPPDIDIGERLINKTMRQHIKSWITTWDLDRLYGDRGAAITIEELPTNYEENADLERAPAGGNDDDD